MQTKTTAIIAGMILIAALASLWFTLGSSPPKVNPMIHNSLGQVLAQEAAQAIHDQGEVVAVIVDAHQQSGAVLHDQWQAFTGELKKHPAIHLAVPEIASLGGHVPLGEILDRHTPASAIVFFVDPPDSGDLAAAANRPMVAKIVAVGNPDLPTKNYYGRFLTSGLLAALIIPRPFSDLTQSAQPKTPREWFDKYYQVYTPLNFATLPE